MKDVDVVIVGAGLSGLSAARIILEHDKEAAKHASEANAAGSVLPASKAPLTVQVLEASDRVGGRTLTDSEDTDLGGAYIGPTQDRITGLVDWLGIKLKKTPVEGKTALNSQGRVSTFNGMIPSLGLLALLDLNAVMVDIDRLTQKVDSKDPHLSPNAKELDTITVEEYLRKNCWTDAAAGTLRVAVRSILCIEPAEVSLLAFAWYIKQSGGPKRIFETRNGAQDSKVIGGAGKISVKLAAKLQEMHVAQLSVLRGVCGECSPFAAASDELISFNSPVREVRYGKTEGDRITVTTVDGSTLSAKYVILAIPPVQQARIAFTPSLDAQRSLALQRHPFGHMIKTFMYYDKPFWKDLGMNGSFVDDSGFVQSGFDDSPAEHVVVGGRAGLSCIMGFGLGDVPNFHKLSVEERKRVICAQYARVFGSRLALTPVHYKEKCWSEGEPWVGGCYTGVPTVGTITRCQMQHAKHLTSHIFVAGTEAAWTMTGYMDGAVEAGERCGRNVLVRAGALPASKFDVMSDPKPSPQMPYVDMSVGWSEILTPSVPQLLGGCAFASLVAVGSLALKFLRSSSKQLQVAPVASPAAA